MGVGFKNIVTPAKKNPWLRHIVEEIVQQTSDKNKNSE